MSNEIAGIAAEMVRAARHELGGAWPEVSDFAERELENLARALVMIGVLAMEGKVSTTQAKLMMDIQKNAARMVMLTAEGLGVVRAERAVNAALGSARAAINARVGWGLL